MEHRSLPGKQAKKKGKQPEKFEYSILGLIFVLGINFCILSSG